MAALSTFIEVTSFTKRLHQLGGTNADEILSLMQQDLIKDPNFGKRVQGLGGIRKARCADPTRGKGKRGGFRYLYYYIEEAGQVFLLFLFDKDEQEDLSNEQRKLLRGALQTLKRTRP